MKMFMVLGALVIPLMLTGCNFIKINIIAGSGIEQAEDGGPGRLPTCGLSGTSPNDCQCSAGCNCPSGHNCAPGTP